MLPRRNSIMHRTIEPAVLYVGTPVVLVSSLNPDGSANLAPISSLWFLGWNRRRANHAIAMLGDPATRYGRRTNALELVRHGGAAEEPTLQRSDEAATVAALQAGVELADPYAAALQRGAQTISRLGRQVSAFELHTVLEKEHRAPATR
jgi:hypothetical protein